MSKPTKLDSRYWSKRFGGKWRSDRHGGWLCNDEKRSIYRVANCSCDDMCDCGSTLMLYGEGCPRKIELNFWADEADEGIKQIDKEVSGSVTVTEAEIKASGEEAFVDFMVKQIGKKIKAIDEEPKP